jgi:polyisoprenyl-phosphate glycosyltransferase
MNNPLKVTVVFSIYNESESLSALFAEINRLATTEPYQFEWLFVNDGSQDDSLDKIHNFCTDYTCAGSTAHYVGFSRNFGHEAAMIAGIDHASGDAIICMDADLQHPLSLIPRMIEKFFHGYQIINMVRTSNKGSFGIKRYLSAAFYRFMNRMLTHKMAENASDFFLVSKTVANIIRKDFRERNRFLRGIIQTIGFKTTTIEFVAPAREAGISKYSLFKLVSLTSHAITSFSKTPLFLGIWFGFIFAAISLILGVYTLVVYLFGTTPPSGYTTIVLFMSFSFMILFFLIGIIGMYVGYLFEEQKARPIYIIEESDISGSN